MGQVLQIRGARPARSASPGSARPTALRPLCSPTQLRLGGGGGRPFFFFFFFFFGVRWIHRTPMRRLLVLLLVLLLAAARGAGSDSDVATTTPARTKRPPQRANQPRVASSTGPPRPHVPPVGLEPETLCEAPWRTTATHTWTCSSTERASQKNRRRHRHQQPWCAVLRRSQWAGLRRDRGVRGGLHLTPPHPRRDRHPAHRIVQRRGADARAVLHRVGGPVDVGCVVDYCTPETDIAVYVDGDHMSGNPAAHRADGADRDRDPSSAPRPRTSPPPPTFSHSRSS